MLSHRSARCQSIISCGIVFPGHAAQDAEELRGLRGGRERGDDAARRQEGGAAAVAR